MHAKKSALWSKVFVVCSSALVLARCGGEPESSQADGEDAAEASQAVGDLGSPELSVKTVAAGAGFACAILGNNKVKCWGLAYQGQLGQGDIEDRGDEAGEMGDFLPYVPLGTGRTAKAIAAGSAHVCAILDNDKVKCWGGNDAGALGLGDTTYRGNQPGEMGDLLAYVNLGTGRTATAITAGDHHTCALLDNGDLKCWGANQDGQLGLGDTNNRGDQPGEMGDNLPPIDVGTSRGIAEVVAGGSHTCARLNTGQIKCWGSNYYGQLGLGHTLDRGDGPNEMGANLAAVDLGTGRTAIGLAAGQTHNCAILDNGLVKCWGGNLGPGFGQGQLGLGDTEHRGDDPGEMGDALPYVPLGFTTVTAISSKLWHTCAILYSGQMKCWGHNQYGALGLGNTENIGDDPGEVGALQPVSLGAGRTVKSVTAGWWFTCAVLDTNRAKCWGRNHFGQLGKGHLNNLGDNAGEMGDTLTSISLGTN